MKKVLPSIFAARLLDEVQRRARRAARGEQIIRQQHRLTGRDGIQVHLDRIRAVFERNNRSRASCHGSLPFFRTGTKPAPSRAAIKRSEDEPAGVNAHDLVHLQ
jgi:hypothetical protein